MSKQLYEEALADVKKLKEIAEDNAKKALIEAVSPRIKDLIEAELLREVGEKEESATDDLLLDDGLEGPAPFALSTEPVESDPAVAAAISPPDEEGKVTLDLDALAVEPVGEEFELSNESAGFVNPLLNKLNRSVALQVESKLFHLGETVEKFSAASRVIRNAPGYREKLSGMVSDVERLYEYLQESAGDLQDKGVYEGKLEDLYKKLNKLTEQKMNKRTRMLSEEDVTLKLTGLPSDVDLEDIGVDLISGDEGEEPEGEEPEGEEGEELDLDLGGDEEEDEEEKAEEAQQHESFRRRGRLSDDTVVEIDEGMLRREISRMKALREEAEVQAWGSGAGDLGDLEDEDLGEPLDLDLRESEVEELDQQDESDAYQAQDLASKGGNVGRSAGSKSGKRSRSPGGDQRNQMDELDQYEEMDQMDQQQEEGDDHEHQGAGHGHKEAHGKQHESILRRIRRENRIQLEAKKQAKQSKARQQEAQKQANQKKQEAQVKQKQKKQQEAQKAKAAAQSKQKQAHQMKEAYDRFARVYNESVKREARLRTMLAESNKRAGSNPNGSSRRLAEGTSDLRNKLAETNLFNTKLLYCNRLLQNEAFTKRQKAEIIERLDEARSEREVKLVYESLTKTLSNTSRSLNESRVVGSSSQATRPASTVLSESVETDRWAKLAGIK